MWRPLFWAPGCGARSTATHSSGKGIPGLQGVRFDSMGLYAVVPVPSLTRWITPPMLTSHGYETREFPEFRKSQGYEAQSYGGGCLATRSFAPKPTGWLEAEDTHGDGETLPPVKQKLPKCQVFDAVGNLLTKGAHMPLLFYIGDKSRRSGTAHKRREQRSTDRHWGPSSRARWRFMQGQGERG